MPRIPRPRSRRALWLVLAAAAPWLDVSAARAVQTDTPGFAPVAAEGGGFGAVGQWVLSVGATSDEYLFVHKQSGGGWQLQLSPALDTFIAPRISVGGVLTYRHASGGTGADTLVLGARAGYDLTINDRFSFWPLAGVYFQRDSANHTSSTNAWLGLFAPFLFHLAPHFFVGAGPSFQLNLAGGNGNQFGVDTLLGGWF